MRNSQSTWQRILQNFCKKTKNFIIHHNSFLHPLDMIFTTIAIYKMHKFFIFLIIYSIFYSRSTYWELLYLPKEELSLNAVAFTEYFVQNNYAYMFYISNLQCMKRIGFPFLKFNDPQRCYCLESGYISMKSHIWSCSNDIAITSVCLVFIFIHFRVDCSYIHIDKFNLMIPKDNKIDKKIMGSHMLRITRSTMNRILCFWVTLC